ncbi:MAG: ABC transporter ATP-binding protein [Porticoccaceae bacterium]|nr:ABC transporter ATP-binding protein [Porticoccaceae bacterium]
MIQVSGLEKSFKRYQRPSDRLREILFRRRYHDRYNALRNINFRVEDGETLGIIGRNGAGKSTLLKILNGVLMPDAGTISSSGRITGLLELGTGFDMGLSGLANIRTNGLLLGMTESELAHRKAHIVEFAELGSFIHEPLRTYSSGMVMRLAFAIAIHADPDIFLVDEALSVGDGHFQQKCMRKIREFRSGGGSIIFVSHDLNAIKMLCDRVVVLSDGEVLADGEPETAVNHYNKLLAGDDVPAPEHSVVDGGYGNFKAAITAVRSEGADSGSTAVTCGEEMLVEAELSCHSDIPPLSLGMMIRDRFGQDMFGTNSHLLGETILLRPGESRRVRFRFPMRLSPGQYTITLALHEGVDHTQHCYHWWDNALRFEVSGIRGPQFGGVCNLNPIFEDG